MKKKHFDLGDEVRIITEEEFKQEFPKSNPQIASDTVLKQFPFGMPFKVTGKKYVDNPFEPDVMYYRLGNVTGYLHENFVREIEHQEEQDGFATGEETDKDEVLKRIELVMSSPECVERLRKYFLAESITNSIFKKEYNAEIESVLGEIFLYGSKKEDENTAYKRGYEDGVKAERKRIFHAVAEPQ